MKKKQLWVVTYNFHPVWAGPAERFLRYYPGLSARDIDVTYITANREGLAKEEVYKGAKVIRLGTEDKTPSVREFIEIATQYALKNSVRPNAFLVLLADYFNAKSIRKLSKNGIKTIYVNTMVFKTSNSRNILKRWASKYFSLRFFRAFDVIVASTNALKKPIIKLGISAQKIKVISNGVSLERFKPATDEVEKQIIRNKFNLPDDEPIALFVGLRVDRKGVTDLVKSWQIYKKQGGKGYLLLVGGEQRENPLFSSFYKEWDELLTTVKKSDNIIIHGPSREIEKYFKVSKIFLFLSKQEGMPNVLTEAMTAGCPVVTTKFEGFSDTWGENGKQIMIVDREHKQIAATINKALNNVSYYEKIRTGALEYVAKEHDVERTLDKYTSLV